MVKSFKQRRLGWREHHAKYPKSWTLFKRVLVDYRAHWRLITGIIVVVGVPVALLSSYVIDPSSDTTLSAYLAFAQLSMNVALVYAVVELLHGRSLTIRQSYYKGSAMLIRLVLVSALLVLMAIFLVLGLFLLLIGALSPEVGLVAGERVLLGMLAVLLTIPSVVLLARGLWALYVIFETDQGPIQALRTSRQLTKGKVVVTLRRLLGLLALLLLLLAAPAIILVVLQGLTHWPIWLALLQVITTLVVLPVANLYLYRYYQALK